jgi:hypothetical protein
MATQRVDRRREVVVPANHELIAIPDEINGQEFVRYFFSDEEADTAFGQEGIEEALAALGSWSDLDWDEAVETLERIRRESKPTPPIDDL